MSEISNLKSEQSGGIAWLAVRGTQNKATGKIYKAFTKMRSQLISSGKVIDFMKTQQKGMSWMIYTRLLNVARHALASCVSMYLSFTVCIHHRREHTVERWHVTRWDRRFFFPPPFFFLLHEPSGGWNRQHFRFSFFPHFSVFLCCREASGKTQTRQTVSLPRQHPKRGCYHLFFFPPHKKGSQK